MIPEAAKQEIAEPLNTATQEALVSFMLRYPTNSLTQRILKEVPIDRFTTPYSTLYSLVTSKATPEEAFEAVVAYLTPEQLMFLIETAPPEWEVKTYLDNESHNELV